MAAAKERVSEKRCRLAERKKNGFAPIKIQIVGLVFVKKIKTVKLILLFFLKTVRTVPFLFCFIRLCLFWILICFFCIQTFIKLIMLHVVGVQLSLHYFCVIVSDALGEVKTQLSVFVFVLFFCLSLFPYIFNVYGFFYA